MRFSERQIRINVQASEGLIWTAVYNGEEHLIVPCVALVGDGVYYGLHAEFPELVPGSELAFSLPTWTGRPVIPEHPPEGTANTPERLDEFQYGQIFYPSFTDNRLCFELWLSRNRAAHAGTTWVIDELEAGNMVEISIGASIELERTSGTNASGHYYGGIWRNIAGDHIAVGLGGGQGACNLDMGCGALRFMSESEMLEANMANETRFTRRIAGKAGSVPVSADSSQPTKGAGTGNDQTKPADVQPPASFLASLATRMGGMWNSVRSLIEDAGQSDWEIRSALADLVNHVDPGFSRVIDVFQDSMTFIYVCFEWSADETYYRRSFTKTAGGVTISDTREEVTNSGGWQTVTPSSEPTQTTVTAAASSHPCGCHNTQQLSATSATPEGEEEEMAKRDDILKRLAALSDEDLEKLVTPPATGTSTAPATAPTETAPAPTATPVTTPAAPAANPAPAVQTPTTTPAADPATLAAAASAILSASGIDVAALNAMLAGEKAKETQMRESLITALSSRTPDLTRELLTPLPTAQLELMARAAGLIGTAATLGLPVDYSGMGLPVQPAALTPAKKYTPPDPFNLRGEKGKTTPATN